MKIRTYKFVGQHFYGIVAAALLMVIGLAVVQMRANSNTFLEHCRLEYTTSQMPQQGKELSQDLHGSLQLSSIINLPEWYRSRSWGMRKDSSLEIVPIIMKGGDGEEETAWNNFFFGTTNGLVLEMGAMNGLDYSVSYFFEEAAKWRSILIEGNPIFASQLSINRPNALNFNAAICDKPTQVHMAEGILEFMTDAFVKHYFSMFLTDGKLDFEKAEADPHVFVVQCFPLTDILLPLKIHHINLFVLDVAGGELRILNGIDFTKFTFDVIVVQTDRGTDSAVVTQEYVDAVTALLATKGYVVWKPKLGRNSWYVSQYFQSFKN